MPEMPGIYLHRYIKTARFPAFISDTFHALDFDVYFYYACGVVRYLATFKLLPV